MIFNREFYLIFWWSVLIHVNVINTEKDDEHVHIKVHVPQVYKKHYHHRTIAKHHFYHPKKLHYPPVHHHEPIVTTHIEPEVDHPLLSAPAIDKYIKWQEKQQAPITFHSDLPVGGYIAEKPKIPKSPLKFEIDEYKFLNGKHNNNNYDSYDSEAEYFSKYSHQFPPSQNSLNNLKNFRIKVENENYKKSPIKVYSNYREEDPEQQDEYTEEDTDSYVENTETMRVPSNSPYSSQSIMVVGDNDHYYDSSSSIHSDDDYYPTSSSNSDYIQNAKRNVNNKKSKFKRPYRDNNNENGWISHISPNGARFNEWSPNNFGKSSSTELNKMSVRKPFSNVLYNGYETINHSNDNNNNYETYIGNEFGSSFPTESRIKGKRPRRKSKPKFSRYLQNGSNFKY